MTWQSDPDEADRAEREDPLEQDADWSPDAATVDCPFCGRTISEESQRCPKCHNWLGEEDWPRRRSWWIVVIVVLLILAFIGVSWI